MLEYLALQNGDELKPLDWVNPFKCLVLISEDVSDAWQRYVSEWLVSTGCLYMMAWGLNCTTWDDSVDNANLEQYDIEPIPDDKFVVTTWHEFETVEEVLHFAKYSANHPDVQLENLLVLDIGAAWCKSALQTMFDKL